MLCLQPSDCWWKWNQSEIPRLWSIYLQDFPKVLHGFLHWKYLCCITGWFRQVKMCRNFLQTIIHFVGLSTSAAVIMRSYTLAWRLLQTCLFANLKGNTLYAGINIHNCFCFCFWDMYFLSQRTVVQIYYSFKCVD